MKENGIIVEHIFRMHNNAPPLNAHINYWGVYVHHKLKIHIKIKLLL